MYKWKGKTIIFSEVRRKFTSSELSYKSWTDRLTFFTRRETNWSLNMMQKSTKILKQKWILCSSYYHHHGCQLTKRFFRFLSYFDAAVNSCLVVLWVKCLNNHWRVGDVAESKPLVEVNQRSAVKLWELKLCFSAGALLMIPAAV